MNLTSIDHLTPRRNHELVSYLTEARPSAHSDVAEALLRASEPLGDVQTTCPNPSQYSYVLLSTLGVGFALAHGMGHVSIRLPPDFAERALACGAEEEPRLGGTWVTFVLFRSDWPAPDLRFWLLKGYEGARRLAVA